MKPRRICAVLILVQVFSFAAVAAGPDQMPVRDMSKAVVDSQLTRTPDAAKFGGWGYAKALYLIGQYEVYKRTGDKRYLDFIKGWIDSIIDPKFQADGTFKASVTNLDTVQAANLLLVLYKETHDDKYKRAAEVYRHGFDNYPRTSDGGFWHATGESRAHQLWGDGVFMGMPFLVRYGKMFGEEKYTQDEAVRQLLTYGKHLESNVGLLYHAYDESGKQAWADPVTHHSAYFWCRAMGWYAMTSVDILDVLPKNHPGRKEIIARLERLIKAFERYQDPKTGLWFQIVDKGDDPNNWLETSSSSMYTYAISVAVKRGYVSKKYQKVADRGYKGVMSKVSVGDDGLTNIADICEGTNVADLAYYYARKRPINDPHGLGAFLLMNEEYQHNTPAMSITVDGIRTKR
jgi:unsaturated rhamnogalacturonyl hydrolase